MTQSGSRSALDRQIAAGITVAVILAAIAGALLAGLYAAPGEVSATDANAVVDAVASAIERGTPAQPLLDTFAAAGTIRAATVYGPNGQALATSGTPSPDVEQVFRSLRGGGSLSIEPRAAAAASSRDLLSTTLIAAICGAVVAALAATWTARVLRKRFDGVRAGIDEAIRDQTYATRVPAEAGALRPMTASLNRLLEQMQQRDNALRRRTTELEAANKDLESFAATVSHDLRAPVGSISGFAQALDEDYGGKLDDLGRECIHWIRESANQMNNIIEGMLQMARLTRVEVNRTTVDVTNMARDIAANLQRAHPDRDVSFVVRDGLTTDADERLLRAVLENLIGNAFKFTSKRPGARIEIGTRDDEGAVAFFVRDNGAGFAPEHAAKMFRPFQRLHSEKEFSGTGIGLATVHRIVQRHGGRVWAEGEPEKGATIYFTTGSAAEWAA